MIDLTDFERVECGTEHFTAINNIDVGLPSAGSSTTPIYINSSGVPTACSYSLGAAASKSVTTSVTSGSSALVTSGAVYTAINNAGSDLTYQSSQPSFDVLFSRSSVSGGYVWTVLRDFYISVTNSGSAGVALLKKGDSFRCSDNHMNIGLGGFTIYISGTSYTVRVTSSNSGISYGTSSSGFRIWY